MTAKQILAAAIFTAATCFATSATAQTYSPTGSGTANDVAATQVDYVTVGATMPYATDTAQAGLAAWKADLAAAGFTNTVTVSTRWYVDNNELAGATDKPSIFIAWPDQPGAHTLKVATGIAVSGVATSCAPAESQKMVYVLPLPVAEFTSANQVLACTETMANIGYKVAGIGQKQLAYTITRKPMGQAATSESSTQNVGTGVTNAGEFEETVDFATASAKYDDANATTGSFAVDNLAPGYIYTIELTGISDQISRKSGVTAGISGNRISVAVTPMPSSTKINHVQNIE